MIMRGLAVSAVMLIVITAAHASEAALASAILSCAGLPDEKAQLACYNRIAAELKPGAVPARQAPIAPPQMPAAPPVQPSDFGKENLPAQAYAPAQRDRIAAKVVDVAYNFFRIFTVTLDNGQVWRQVDSDTRKARFKNDRTETVTITRGFMDSYHLTINGAWGDYTVKRIK
jgi:hypothetical protein